MVTRPRLVISALRGGSGKTILTLGMVSAWCAQGRRVAAFKKGPDYIDAGWLGRAATRPCRNLDPYLMGPEVIVSSFTRHTADVEMAVIEGNRGLFDGVNVEGTFSTAELAKLLCAPVILVVDCTKVTRTVGALVKGCLDFDPDVIVGGVILNQTAGARHRRLVRSVIEQYTDLPVLGEVPRMPRDAFPERHMGLIPPQEHDGAGGSLAFVRDLARDHLDLERLWQAGLSAPPLDPGPALAAADDPIVSGPPVRIGVVRDSAFQFYYPENIEALAKAGAEVVELSALSDTALPDLGGLYLGGGFPETHAAALAANEGFREAVRTAALRGMPIWAECGGLIYLGRELVVAGVAHRMAGVFDLRLVLERRPQAHGYTGIIVEGDNPFFPLGRELAAHEFHYCRVDRVNLGPARLVFKNDRGQGVIDGRDGLVWRNVLATFSHLHSLATPDWAPALVKAARSWRESGDRSGLLMTPPIAAG